MAPKILLGFFLAISLQAGSGSAQTNGSSLEGLKPYLVDCLHLSWPNSRKDSILDGAAVEDVALVNKSASVRASLGISDSPAFKKTDALAILDELDSHDGAVDIATDIVRSVAAFATEANFESADIRDAVFASTECLASSILRDIEERSANASSGLASLMPELKRCSQSDDRSDVVDLYASSKYASGLFDLAFDTVVAMSAAHNVTFEAYKARVNESVDRLVDYPIMHDVDTLIAVELSSLLDEANYDGPLAAEAVKLMSNCLLHSVATDVTAEIRASSQPKDVYRCQPEHDHEKDEHSARKKIILLLLWLVTCCAAFFVGKTFGRRGNGPAGDQQQQQQQLEEEQLQQLQQLGNQPELQQLPMQPMGPPMQMQAPRPFYRPFFDPASGPGPEQPPFY